MWVILPGLALTPADYSALSRDLRGIVFDAWVVDLTAPIDEIRAHILSELRSHHGGREAHEKLSLLGHSMGGLLALEWAARFPDEVATVVLADPTPPANVTPSNMSARQHRVVAGMLAPVLPALRAGLWAAQTRSKEHLGRQELKRRYGTHTGARALVRHNSQCAALQQRVDQALRGSGLPGNVTILQLVGAPSAPPRWREYLDSDPRQQGAGSPPRNNHTCSLRTRSALRAAVRWGIAYAEWGLQRRFVAEQRDLSQRIGSRLEFLDGVNHLFPITHPRRVIARMRAAAAEWGE